MWFRKRIKGCRIQSVCADWPHRRLALSLNSTESPWLILDLCRDPEVRHELPDGYGREPEWPSLQRALTRKDVWKEHPQITPPLRRTLAALAPDEAAALYERLKQGPVSGGPFYFYCQPNGAKARALVWKLPPSLADNLSETVLPTAVEAAARLGRQQVKEAMARLDTRETVHRRRMKKVRRALGEIDREEERMQDLIALQDQGRALQSNLYRLDQREKLARVTIDGQTGQKVLDLDPELTVLENMERFFKLAKKGRRGLSHLARRRQELDQELQTLASGKLPAQGRAQPQGAGKPTVPALPARWKNLAVQVYSSSDGFAIVRGKNQKANHRLLSQAARSFDIWFHALDGPGAHVILKRDHEAQEVPERSLEEAAVLAGLASHQSMSDRASVVSALVRDVRKIKGAGLGRVRIDKVWRTFSVGLDPELEKKLRR